MNTHYEYMVKTLGGSSYDNLEALGERLNDALASTGVASEIDAGWELWQVNLVEREGCHGEVFIFRRPRA